MKEGERTMCLPAFPFSCWLNSSGWPAQPEENSMGYLWLLEICVPGSLHPGYRKAVSEILDGASIHVCECEEINNSGLMGLILLFGTGVKVGST